MYRVRSGPLVRSWSTGGAPTVTGEEHVGQTHLLYSVGDLFQGVQLLLPHGLKQGLQQAREQKITGRQGG